MTALADLHQAVLTGDAVRALVAARSALDAGTDPADLVAQSIGPAMREAGELFESGEYFVPELLMAARATKGVFDLLRPMLARQGIEPVGCVVLGTVQGDLHDIGKNLVAAMLEGGGFEVIDLGVSVTPEQFVGAIQQRSVDIVGLSALLTTTMPTMKATLDTLRATTSRNHPKVIVGGAPVTPAFAASIGADGYAENAAAAVTLARHLLGRQPLDLV
jgi:5-methyltetrahydrofolate--homocysteine methyltransferase